MNYEDLIQQRLGGLAQAKQAMEPVRNEYFGALEALAKQTEAPKADWRTALASAVPALIGGVAGGSSGLGFGASVAPDVMKLDLSQRQAKINADREGQLARAKGLGQRFDLARSELSDMQRNVDKSYDAQAQIEAQNARDDKQFGRQQSLQRERLNARQNLLDRKTEGSTGQYNQGENAPSPYFLIGFGEKSSNQWKDAIKEAKQNSNVLRASDTLVELYQSADGLQGAFTGDKAAQVEQLLARLTLSEKEAQNLGAAFTDNEIALIRSLIGVKDDPNSAWKIIQSYLNQARDFSYEDRIRDFRDEKQRIFKDYLVASNVAPGPEFYGADEFYKRYGNLPFYRQAYPEYSRLKGLYEDKSNPFIENGVIPVEEKTTQQAAPKMSKGLFDKLKAKVGNE